MNVESIPLASRDESMVIGRGKAYLKWKSQSMLMVLKRETKMPLEGAGAGLVMIKWHDMCICCLHSSYTARVLNSTGKIPVFLGKPHITRGKEPTLCTPYSAAHNSDWFYFYQQMNRGLADFKGEVETMNISGEGILHFPGSSAMTAHQSNYKQTFLSFLQDTKNDS